MPTAAFPISRPAFRKRSSSRSTRKRRQRSVCTPVCRRRCPMPSRSAHFATLRAGKLPKIVAAQTAYARRGQGARRSVASWHPPKKDSTAAPICSSAWKAAAIRSSFRSNATFFAISSTCMPSKTICRCPSARKIWVCSTLGPTIKTAIYGMRPTVTTMPPDPTQKQIGQVLNGSRFQSRVPTISTRDTPANSAADSNGFVTACSKSPLSPKKTCALGCCQGVDEGACNARRRVGFQPRCKTDRIGWSIYCGTSIPRKRCLCFRSSPTPSNTSPPNWQEPPRLTAFSRGANGRFR